MTEQVKSKVAGTAKGAMPWKKGVAWWVVLLEGILLLLLGGYMFFAQTSSFFIMGYLVSLALAISGAFNIFLAVRAAERNDVRTWTLIRGVIGLVAGLIVLLLLFFKVLLEGQVGFLVLGLGSVGYAAIGLYILLDKNLVPLRRISIISTIFFLVIGVLLLLTAFGVGTLRGLIEIMNLLIIAAGIALVFWAFILRRGDEA